VLLLAVTSGTSSAQHAGGAADDLDVLTDTASAQRVVPDSLNELALQLLADRERRIATIDTRAELEQRQRFVREELLRAIGGLPERTPLNPRVTGTIERDGYRIEKVVFESQPGFYVTANLYVPATGRAPYPGILLPLGHDANGKANVATQHLAITFAKNGFVVLVFEPLGQGERIQLYSPETGASRVQYASVEHTLAGTQCLLLGHSVARHMIWDGIRALDYLTARPEVDASRIGCTGNSGGGTQTAYLSVLDDRIKVAAPSCYLTSWKSLLATMGPQDAEQNLPSSLAAGIDHADLVAAFAPKPYLILSAVHDFFPIEGSRATFGEAKRLYELAAAGDKLDLFEADDTHGYSAPRRAAVYRFMNRWLKGSNEPIAEPTIAPQGEKVLRATAGGQVSTSIGGETIFSINRAEARNVAPARRKLSTAVDLRAFQTELRARVERLTAFVKSSTPPNVHEAGLVTRDGYRIEKLSFESEPGIVIPALVFVPDGPPRKRHPILFVDQRGKAAHAEPGGKIERLVRDGALVLAFDMRGTGETREDESRAWRPFGSFKSAMTALLVGKTLVGLRALDVVRAVDVLAAREDVDMSTLAAVGKGGAALVVLHAAILDDRIKSLKLDKLLVSYASAFTWKTHRGLFESVVPGVLAAYDVPDLVAGLAPRTVAIRNALNPRRARVELAEVERQYEVAVQAYQAAGAPQALVIEAKAQRRRTAPQSAR
jgi:cephalosporin-C deacetylase-like acetyl esterase